MDMVMAWVDDCRAEKRDKFARWKVRVGAKWTPSHVAVQCCPFWLENGFYADPSYMDSAFGYDYDDEYIDWGSEGCGYATGKRPAESCARKGKRGRGCPQCIPFPTSTAHPLITLSFRVDDDEAAVVEATLSHPLDPLMDACVAVGGVNTSNDPVVYTWSGKYVRDVSGDLKSRLRRHLVWASAPTIKASDAAWRAEQDIAAAAAAAEDAERLGLASLRDFRGNLGVILAEVALWVDLPTLFSMYRGSRALRRAAITAARTRVSAAKFTLVVGSCGILKRNGDCDVEISLLNRMGTDDDVTFWEERFRRHDIPLRFERRSGWSSTLLPVEAAKTVEWDLDMYHVEGYDEERPDDAVSYIGEKMLLQWHPSKYDGVKNDLFLGHFITPIDAGGRAVFSHTVVHDKKTARGDGALIQYTAESTDGPSRFVGKCTVDHVQVHMGKLMKIAARAHIGAMRSKLDQGIETNHDRVWREEVLEPMAKYNEKKL